MPSRAALNVSLTPELTSSIADRVASGQYRSASEVVREALRLLDQGGGDGAAADLSVLLRLADRIGPLDDAQQIMTEAAFLLGAHLKADRAAIAELGADDERLTVLAEWMGGETQRCGESLRLQDFGAGIAAPLRRGDTVAFAALAGEQTISVAPEVADRFACMRMQAAVIAPVIQDGRPQALVIVHQRQPRDWAARDVALVREVAGRTWAAVQRARARAVVAASEARLRVLVDAMPQMIWVSDAQGNHIFGNARFREFAGPGHWLAGKAWVELVHPDDRVASQEARQQSLLSGKPFEREHRLRRYDGVYRWTLARALPMPDATGAIECWLGTSTDITEIVEARELLSRSYEELERLVEERTQALRDAANELAAEMRRREELQSTVLQTQKLEALGQLTSGVAHDFNNVLAAIVGSYSLIRRRAADPGLVEYIEYGERAAERAGKLIGQLLSFVRREKLAPKLIQLARLLPGAQDLLHHAVGAGMQCDIRVAEDVWPVLADPYQLEVALLNLAVNARDAMAGTGTIVISAANLSPGERPASLPPGDYVAIAVHDTGHGMPAEVMARATEPFFTTKPHGEGTGLGLPMVQGFATRSGGCLQIESAPATGTVVRIILPRTPIDSQVATGEGAPGPSVSLHGDATLLLVDSDTQFRQVTASFLRELGYHVLEAGNAATAAALVHTLRQLDLLITEEDMTAACGSRLAQRLRAEWPGLPVQFLSAAPAGPQLAGEAVLHKPFSFTTLGVAVLERLGRWTPPDSGSDRLLKRLRTPALRQFYLNWQTARVDGVFLPTLNSLDPLRFGLGPYTFTVAVEVTEPPVFRFLSVGAALTQRLGRSLSGMPIDRTPQEDDFIGALEEAYRRCARNLAPVYHAARFDFGDGAPLHLERLLLPLSNDAKTITHLIGITLFSEPATPTSSSP